MCVCKTRERATLGRLFILNGMSHVLVLSGRNIAGRRVPLILVEIHDSRKFSSVVMKAELVDIYPLNQICERGLEARNAEYSPRNENISTKIKFRILKCS